MSAEIALAGALAQRLAAAPAVAAIVGTRVHAAPPRMLTYPCVSVGRIESRPVGEGDLLEHVVTITCASRFGGPEEARAMVAAARLALHDAAPAVEGRVLASLKVRFSDVFAAADDELTLGVLRVRAVSEPA
ncbi:DUF3168 domain-containing protein [Caulobacter sp. CCNWLY153]|uniref:DUF3168 domain-containing protein n=1 Tax=Caulobacter TaxID=75 RepID=UPI001FAE996A|nr:DUF3168 domain-containing protein [Caulobacter radicis]